MIQTLSSLETRHDGTAYEQEQAALKERVAQLRTEMDNAQEAGANVEKFMNVVR